MLEMANVIKERNIEEDSSAADNTNRQQRSINSSSSNKRDEVVLRILRLGANISALNGEGDIQQTDRSSIVS